MEELMMNMLTLIAEEVRHKQDLFDEESKIVQKLVSVGYPLHEADAALTLMQSLVQKQAEHFFGMELRPLTTRAMNREERSRFTQEAFGFAVKLNRLGVMSDEQREDLLEKALTIYPGQIELGHIKTLLAFMLFSSAQERDNAVFPDLRRIKNTAWN